jgi:HlyD family type I secretion membrane fusion protein
MSFITSIKHHWDVLLSSWQEEKDRAKAEPKGPKSKRDELEFLPAAIEVMETPASPLGRTIAITIVVFFTIAVFWTIIGKMDIIATAAGKIIPTARVKIIQPLESGVVRAIAVEEGQSVKKGQVLVELDPTGAEADLKRLSHELMTARTEAARLSALLEANPPRSFAPPQGAAADLIVQNRNMLRSQWQEHLANLDTRDAEIKKRKAERASIEAEITRLTRVLPNIRSRVEGSRKLMKKGYVAKATFLELEQQLLELQGQLGVQRKRFDEANSSLSYTRKQRKQVEAEFNRTIIIQRGDALKRAKSFEQDVIKAQERSRLQTLRAPVDGVVQQLVIHTVGGVVTPAQELMVIVPADTRIEVQVMVLNKDIGFVHTNQRAEIKIESFPFTKYGTIDGKVLHISRDAVQDEKLGLIYPARVEMAKSTILSGNKEVRLTPGMVTTVEIKTGKRRLIEYILAPLQRYQDESMRER